jgi:DNA-directed RNA polymerase beta' subunit
MLLYDEVLAICSGKKGEIRNLFSGRFNMSSRNVIKQNPDLRIDQVELPYVALVICNEQLIINVLMRTFNISPQEAWDRWYKAIGEVDPVIVQVLEDLIHNSCDGEGLPVIINRNPSIANGSILQMYCVGINYDFTMSMPLQILPLLAADFDKQTLSHIWDDKPCVKSSLIKSLETCNARLATA